MAICKFIDNPIRSEAGLKSCIKYIMSPQKTNEEMIGGKDTDIRNIALDFESVKSEHHKNGGRLATHFELSFSPAENVSWKTAKAAAEEVLKLDEFKDFQVIYGVHTDKKHTHIHFLINAVGENGKKWHQSKKDLFDLKNNISKNVCEKLGLEPVLTDGEAHQKENTGKYYAKKFGRSYRFETKLAVENIMKRANSKSEFIRAMESLGYKVDWNDRQKYIRFITPEGKIVRNKIFDKNQPDRFSKEAIEKQFSENNSESWRLKRFIEVINMSPDKPYPLTNLIPELKETRLTLYHVAKRSRSMKTFIAGMKNLDYDIEFSDKYPDMLITAPSGRKLSTDMLYDSEKFTRDALRDQFNINAAQADLNLFIGLVQLAREGSRNSYPVSNATDNAHTQSMEGNALKEYLHRADRTAARFNKNLISSGYEENER